MLTLFFSDQISTGQRQVLENNEAHHAIKVLRLNTGEVIKISDGVGNWVSGPIVEIAKKELFICYMERSTVVLYTGVMFLDCGCYKKKAVGVIFLKLALKSL